MKRRGVFRHLTYTDRIKIEALHTRGDAPKDIAAFVGFSLSTIYRELRRGKYERLTSELVKFTTYSADVAQKDYDYKATNKGAGLKIGHDYKLANHIEQKILHEHYSPAAVIGGIPDSGVSFDTQICVKTVYNYVNSHVFLNLSNENLPRGGRQKRSYMKIHKGRIKNPLCRSIEDRPAVVEERKEFGHWEMDTVIGKAKGKGQVLLVLTERMTRQEIVMKLKHKTTNEVVKALNRLERKHATRFYEMFKTITVDNGSEFIDNNGMETSCRRKGIRTFVYYCHPYSSWERGSNENANSIIRRFIPKSAPIENYTVLQVEYVQNWINNYPRKILEFGCSNALFTKCIEEIETRE